MAKKTKTPEKPAEEVNKGGAPTKITDEKRLEIIVNALRLGSHFDVAAYMAGLNPRTVKNYMIRAQEDPTSLYGFWLTSITKALADSETRDLAVIDQAAQGRPAQYLMIPSRDKDGNLLYNAEGKPQMEAQLDGDGKPIKIKNEQYPQWQASAWKLERRAPKRWGRFDRLLEDDLEGFGKDPSSGKTEEERIEAGDAEARLKRAKRIQTVLDAVPEDSDLGEV